MSKINLDSIVKSTAEKITREDIDATKKEVETQIDGRAWNMNQPLNMIAYEDQK
ncbi:hypothetical protein PMI16_00193 [Herbaspirillum sp. CF444]|uniref:hypothetical protein n=1 Tax=Herbaspirillum sp. CF444 TaxID=1144319 RepID=UPI000272398D|nr:hypothetical protein [Herbaspirillum sp. CF444]EJL94422.1 hypothetical protein PMI16_00193 [Herbaspirillum sp. CF444]